MFMIGGVGKNHLRMSYEVHPMGSIILHPQRFPPKGDAKVDQIP